MQIVKQRAEPMNAIIESKLGSRIETMMMRRMTEMLRRPRRMPRRSGERPVVGELEGSDRGERPVRMSSEAVMGRQLRRGFDQQKRLLTTTDRG